MIVFSISTLLTDEIGDLSFSSMLLLLLSDGNDLGLLVSMMGLGCVILISSSLPFILSWSGNRSVDGISMRREDEYCIGLMPDASDLKRGCSDNGCFLMVNGLALMGKSMLY